MRIWFCLITLLALSMASCVKDPVTGKTTLNFVSDEQEVAIGKREHENVVAMFGLYDDPEWQAYVNDIGQEIAKVSHRPELDYHFYVVDSPVVNAFALPGGYIYFTRGILAHFNSKDELAGVMGHEIGHVVARHGTEQMSRQTLMNVGLVAASIASEDVRKYVPYASLGLGLLSLRFSREQESESDRLGVRYTTNLGYDSHRMAQFFKTIDRLSGDSGQQVPNFLSTHPDPVDREARVHKLTDQYRAETDYRPRNLDPSDYLAKLDGLIFGEDPRNGFVEKADAMFYHPRWSIQFPVPDGWSFQRAQTAFQMVSDNQKGAIIWQKTDQYDSAAKAAEAFGSQQGITVLERDSVGVNSFSGVALTSEAKQEQSSLRLYSRFLEKDGAVFVGHALAQEGDFAAFRASFDQALKGFGRLTNNEAMRKQPDRLKVRKAPRSGSFADVLAALNIKDNEMKARLALLNGVELNDSIQRGQLIKIVD